MAVQSKSDDTNTLSNAFDGDDPTWAVSVREQAQAGRPGPAQQTNTATAPATIPEKNNIEPAFWPRMPEKFEDTGLRPSQLEALILKCLLNFGTASGREISNHLALPFKMVHGRLYELKEAQLLSLRSDAPLGDYQYELTEFGVNRGRRHADQSTYFGAAPVPLEQYAASVEAQSIQNHPLSMDHVRNAYGDLVLTDDMLSVIGESLNLGRGLFLYGAPGNGKSSIAERVSRAFTHHAWIPRAISVGGEIVRMFDSIHHKAVPETDDSRPFDHRWIRIERPTIVVGGELGLDSFDVTTNPITGISEAPLQLKANAGTLVIDDFGRNSFRPEALLNRLVVPMERGADSLHLKSGRTFRVPFDCMMVFSSNLAPADLVDEAFLRRIPYKVDVLNPTEEDFKKIYRLEAAKLELAHDEADLEALLTDHYRNVNRPMRCCHPRDLLRLIANACDFHKCQRVVTREALNHAVRRYLDLMTATSDSK